MSHNPCHHTCDWTDGDTPIIEDAGCCSPLPLRKDCEAPAIPQPDCGETPTVTYDPETEKFVITSTIFDENCSPLLDSNGSPLKSISL